MLAVLLSVSGSSPVPTDLKTYLSDNGLECCIAAITRQNSWWSVGAGIDSPSDMRFLSDSHIDRLPMPDVKRNILKTLAGEAREDARAERAQRARLGDMVSTFIASAETISRGFMLGFGVSFIYETLLLNRDFYAAESDLAARVRRASFRALVLGCATAVTMHGSAIIVPHWLRHNWLK